ncbi:heme-dependent oxidative N-demethylase family protein [Roseomonas sp. USHLN139]|uniref:heme-dependent oxidative N-demethylase family protein n=1 Tax=Roseomonas sp. USHLN139 TaxID=3081298 RepID=UPI003B01B288
MSRPPLPPPLLHLPYETGAFRMALGLQSVPEVEWLEIDATYPAQLAERRRLIATRRAEVIGALPGTEAAQQELLAMLAAHLPRRYPGWFDSAGGVLENRLDGTRQALATPDPLAALGGLVQEDFCLLRQEAGEIHLVGAALCFPSRWRLAEKLGRPLGLVHQPVPFYGEQLQRPVDRFIGLLKPGRLAVRLNWSVIDDAALFQPSGHDRAEPAGTVTAGNAGSSLVLRVERQSFRRLPESGLVVFGIRIHVTPLAQVTALPGEAARLREAVLALPPAMARYKSLLPFRPALLDYLDTEVARGG